MENTQTKYINVNDIQNEYLPISKKKIRFFVKKYLQVKTIGGRLFVEREALENLLADNENQIFALKWVTNIYYKLRPDNSNKSCYLDF